MPKAYIHTGISHSKKLPNGLSVPTKESLFSIHDEILREGLKEHNVGHLGNRDVSIIEQLCWKLSDHKYKDNLIENSYYISTEIFFSIACRHPFIDGNKRTAYASAMTFAMFNLLTSCLSEKEAVVEMREDESTGRTIETIARWGEGSDYSSLIPLVNEAGLLGKRQRDLNEEDVKRFINHFIRNNIHIVKVEANDKKR